MFTEGVLFVGRKKLFEDRTKYIDDWAKANKDKIVLKFPKGEKAIIQGFAKHSGLSVTSFMLVAVTKYRDKIFDSADKEEQKEILKLIDEFREKENENSD